MLKEYLVRYNINKRDYFGVAVVVASSEQNAIEILKAQGAYNGTPNSYIILEVALINDTDQYNAACILEEIFTTNGDSAYELAVKHGYKGTETQWLESLKGEKGDPGSGDSMYYVCKSIGAKWNANTGYWEFYDMTDITNEQMAKALARGSWYTGATAIGALTAFNEQSISAIRFNIARTGPWSATCDFDYFAQENKWIEFINLTFDNTMISKPYAYASYLAGSFNGCSNLRRIYGEINVLDTKNAFTDTFKGCVKLEDVEIYGLNKDISFADSPLLSKESLLYMINNCAWESEFTITLHPDVYDKCQFFSGGEWAGEIDSAIDNADNTKGTTVILASA